MDDNFGMGIFVGMLIAGALLVMLFSGFSLHDSARANDCQKYGHTTLGDKVYQCLPKP